MRTKVIFVSTATTIGGRAGTRRSIDVQIKLVA